MPHVYGLTDAAAAFGAGYVAVEDRLPIIMLLDALGRAEAFELLGDNASWLADAEIARLYGYTDDEFQQMIDRLPTYSARPDRTSSTSSAAHARHERGARRHALGLIPVPPSLAELGGLPAPFRPTDIVAIVSIVRALFGAGGGGELGNAARILSSSTTSARERGPSIYEDFRNRFNDDGPCTPPTRSRTARCPAPIDPARRRIRPYGGGDPGLQGFFEELLPIFPGGIAQAAAQSADLAEQARIKSSTSRSTPRRVASISRTPAA